MSTRPENTLWDVAQLNAAKPTDAQPFSGSHGNQRTEDQALRSAAIRLASSTADPLLKKALLRELTAGCEKLPEGPMRDNCESGGPNGKGKKKDDGDKKDDGKKDDGKMPADLLEKFKKKDK